MISRCLKYAILLGVGFCAGRAKAQAIQQVIGASGGTAITPNGYTIDFTIGDSHRYSRYRPSCTEGFQQPQPLKHLPDSNLTAAGWYLKVYPNPVHDQLTIHAYMDQRAPIDCQVVDMLGHVLLVRQFSFQQGYNDAMLQLSALARGVYVLYINDPVHHAHRSIKLLKD